MSNQLPFEYLTARIRIKIMKAYKVLTWSFSYIVSRSPLLIRPFTLSEDMPMR